MGLSVGAVCSGIREAVSICAEAQADVVEMASPVRYE